MWTGAIVTTAALVLSTVDVAAAAGPQTDPYRAELQTALDDLRDLGVVGAQGQVSFGRRNTLARSGTATLGGGAPMPLRGHFRIGSNTKTFVSVVVLQLAGEGRLSLDDTVERWLPGVVSGNGNDGTRITVRQLLQHTSGIHNYTNDLPALASAEGFEEHRLDRYAAADLVALAMRHPSRFAPGTHWDYSNTNYILAGMLIESVTGQAWAEQVRSRIARPLGLRDTYYDEDAVSPARPYARSYQQFAPGGPLVDTTVFRASAGDAAGGMVSTTDDLAVFWRALQRGELLRPREMAQLRQTVLAETLQPVMPGLRYGLGIFWVPNSCGGGYWGHPGDVPGTSTVNGVTESGERAVVLYRTTDLVGPGAGVALDNRAFRLVDDIICG